ncbi:MAG: segregation/condensation protein A [Calditrichia bacterium]
MDHAYKIRLPIFEGPFDLLLYLIRKHEVDIYDIPIAQIIRQYLEYIKLMKMLDLDIAGEFIEMVATLMLIKVRMLLPTPVLEGEEEPEDPRAQLVAQLLEYQQFKIASQSLGELEAQRRRYFPRSVPDQITSNKDGEEDEFLEDVSLFDLLTAFKRALDNIPKVTVHKVNVIKITIEEQVAFLFRQIGKRPYALFREIVKPLRSRMELIVTFMALLDLMRLQFLCAKQSEAFGEIRIIPLQPLTMEGYLKTRDQELMAENAAETQS